MSSGYIDLPYISGGGGGVVTSVSDTNSINLTLSVGNLSGDLRLSPNAADAGFINAAYTIETNGLQVQVPIADTSTTGVITDTDWDIFNNKQDAITAATRQFIYNSGSVIEGVPGWFTNEDTGGLELSLGVQPNNDGGYSVNSVYFSTDPLQNSPNQSYNIYNNFVDSDINDSGFSQGTNGLAFRFTTNFMKHEAPGDLGSIEFTNNNASIGNGTDAITLQSLGYQFGFGQINANVSVLGPLQGYGYQLNVDAAASLSNSSNTQAFYDNANVGCSSPSYTSFNGSPTIAEIRNNNNYNGISLNPTIPLFSGNAGFAGLGIYGNLGTFGTGSFQAIDVNPTVANVKQATGINISMDNVTVYPGVVASVVIQDITISADLPSSAGNAATIEFTPGGTAGAEVVTVMGLATSVQIQSGVSTATQIVAALAGNFNFNINFNAVVSGVGSNPQVTQAATNLAGGEDVGTKRAGYFDGDVEITGNLTFGGALSIGKLSAFASQAIIDGGGNPSSINSLVCQPTVAANATIANADTLGLNTAMLLSIGDNATVTTSLVGIAALALPAVVTMGTGSTVDIVSGATFAVSLDGAATGGTIDTLNLCRSVAIPNGITAITNLRGYAFDLPLGDPGTTTWGFYESPGSHNYFQGNLLIGGTAGSDDTVSNSSTALEIKSTTKAFRASSMTTTQRDALTALAGMMLFNTTTSKFQGYDGATWNDFH